MNAVDKQLFNVIPQLRLTKVFSAFVVPTYYFARSYFTLQHIPKWRRIVFFRYVMCLIWGNDLAFIADIGPGVE